MFQKSLQNFQSRLLCNLSPTGRKDSKSSRLRQQRGLTLVEILIVLVILGTVMTFVGGRIFGSGDRAKAKLTQLKIKKLAQDISSFELEYNKFPQSLNELHEGSDRLGDNFIPMISKDDLVDAWDTPFRYELIDGGIKYKITSLGADKKSGGEGADADIFGEGP